MFGTLKFLEARLQAEVDNFVLGRNEWEDDMITYRPRCCGCKNLAVGRICYAGKQNNIIDNPFCRECYPEIYKQTYKLLKEFFGKKVESEWIMLQKWHIYQAIPSMPVNMAQIIGKGTFLYAEPPSFNSIP